MSILPGKLTHKFFMKLVDELEKGSGYSIPKKPLDDL